MKKFLNLLVVLLVFLVFSCSSSQSSNDTDVMPDADSNSDDIETVDDDSGSQGSEIVDDSDETPDADSDSDSEKPDSDECQPPLSEAPFPYYDTNGKITFCRPNCDTPTADDPICIGNLWDEQNDALCHEYPEYACCGTPCVLDSLKPMTKEEVDEMYTVANTAMHKCDLKISPWNLVYDGSNGVVKSWNMSEGKIGFHVYPAQLSPKEWSVGRKHIAYDIKTQKYFFIIPAYAQEQVYFKGKRLGLVSDKRSYDLNNENIFLAYISDDGKVEIVYDKKVKSISYEPALNEKWAFVNLVDANGKRMLYAKVGEWKWTSLGNGLGWKPSIVGDRLALYQDNFKGYICDLNKYPKNLDECYNVNNGEELRYIVLNKEDSNKVVYSSVQGKIVLMEYKNGKWNYSDLITSYSDEISGKVSVLGFIINMFSENMLLYEEAFNMGAHSQIMANKLCYYNLKSKKSYCMKKMENDSEYDGIPAYPYGDAEFEGKWLLYQKINSTPLILRNMECYCKEENICPFEE